MTHRTISECATMDLRLTPSLIFNALLNEKLLNNEINSCDKIIGLQQNYVSLSLHFFLT